ncbi:hypothetical protein LUZ61_007183 [Rhynchospora tenuis]|uniref:F-box domain-containing protein n=1 Tax=Rhynchospora tenuis TaxID=198213 RepID=A0AAD5ZT64_9POAL|nr:hypothetical protein LUZ61_007183 [Rhynchospora tenuis]
MKLRIQHVVSMKTICIAAPDNASLLDLKALIASYLVATSTNPNPDPIAPDSIHLSLNKHYELISPNASDPLSSLGLALGSLIFLSFTPFCHNLNPPEIHNSNHHVYSSGATSSSNNPIDSPSSETTVKLTSINQPTAPVEVDAGPTYLIPGFLLELMNTETGVDAGILEQVVMLTHCTLLDMGWTSHASSLRLEYTIPDFVNQLQAINKKVAVVKLSMFGHFVTMYGHLGGINPDFYCFCFDLVKVAALLSMDLNSMKKSEQEQLMEIFCAVKDEMALPLMIDLCLKNGLPLPPCFMFLPIDMKAKILDLLPGTGVVRVGSTCKEMRDLSFDENLWKQKMVREFRSCVNNISVISAGTWKERYKRARDYIVKIDKLNRRIYIQKRSSRRLHGIDDNLKYLYCKSSAGCSRAGG